MDASDDTDGNLRTRAGFIFTLSNPSVSSVSSGFKSSSGRNTPLAKSGSRGIRHTWPRPGAAAAPRSCPKPSRKGPACFGHQRGGAAQGRWKRGNPRLGRPGPAHLGDSAAKVPLGLPPRVPVNEASQRGSVLPGLELAPTHHDGARFIIFPLPFAGFVSSSPDNAKGRGRCNRGGAGSV
jgi:hypothetical protein